MFLEFLSDIDISITLGFAIRIEAEEINDMIFQVWRS
jgi:hypothetical protein